MSQQNLQQQSDTAGNYVLFSTEQLLEVKAGMDRTYLPFFDNANLSMGIYELKAGAVDEQNPHELDEVYYVLDGKCKFEVEGESMDVVPGAILFVRAKASHRFYDIENDVKLLVFFTKSTN
jgi:quercetin dioxygenase-like cupin family protein